jgi:hypothetical protein
MWIDRDGFERDGTRDGALALQPAQSRYGEYRLVIEPPEMGRSTGAGLAAGK